MWEPSVDSNDIGIPVEQGVVSLRGDVASFSEKGIAECTSDIIVKPRVGPTDVKDKIEAAFKRSAEVDARRVNVTAQDGKVVLTGNVRSWAERRAAERAVWAAPGVMQIDDRLTIVP